MTPGEHEALLKVLLKCKGHVYISGYRSGLYDQYLAKWERIEWRQSSAMSADEGDGRERTECMWATGRAGYFMGMNY